MGFIMKQNPKVKLNLCFPKKTSKNRLFSGKIIVNLSVICVEFSDFSETMINFYIVFTCTFYTFYLNYLQRC